MTHIGRHAVPLAAALLAALTACTRPVDGQATPARHDPTFTEPPTTTTTRTTPPRTTTTTASTPAGPNQTKYKTAEPTEGDLPPDPNAYEACDLMSWEAFPRSVWPAKDHSNPPGPNNPADPASRPPVIKHLPPRMRTAKFCKLDNSLIRHPGDPIVLLIQLVLWPELEPFKTPTTIADYPATMEENAADHNCAVAVPLNDTKIGVSLTNTRYTGTGQEPCTLARAAAEWAVKTHTGQR